jgi:hypothetical protein
VLPNCAVKHKRDTKWLVADQMLSDVIAASAGVGSSSGSPAKKAPVASNKITDFSGLQVRRPHERVRAWHQPTRLMTHMLSCMHHHALD